jgi:hypothetical protein
MHPPRASFTAGRKRRLRRRCRRRRVIRSTRAGVADGLFHGRGGSCLRDSHVFHDHHRVAAQAEIESKVSKQSRHTVSVFATGAETAARCVATCVSSHFSLRTTHAYVCMGPTTAAVAGRCLSMFCGPPAIANRSDGEAVVLLYVLLRAVGRAGPGGAAIARRAAECRVQLQTRHG